MDHPQRDHRRGGGNSAHDAWKEVREDTMDNDEKTESGLLTED